MKKYTKEECYTSVTSEGKIRYWNPRLVNLLIGISLIIFGVITFVIAQGENNTFGFLSVFFGVIVMIIPVKDKKTRKH